MKMACISYRLLISSQVGKSQIYRCFQKMASLTIRPCDKKRSSRPGALTSTDEISRTITDLSNTLKELQVIFKEQTTKSEDPAQKSIEHVSSIDVSAKGQQADCSVFGKLPFELSNMTKQPTEQSPGNKLSPIGQPVDSSFFGRTPFEMRNMFKEAAEQGTGKVSPIGQQIDCPFFSKLPSEIRNMIYNHVLVSSNPIRPVYQLVGDYRAERRSRRRAGVSEPSGVKPPEDIDSGLLQTCRRAYEEAISILYGENTFVFSEKYGMILFQTSGVNWLGITKSSQSKHGRLNLIRRASLEMRPYTTFEDLYGDWSTFIDPDRNEIHFPALEVLEVDCSMLGLPDEEVPMVSARSISLELSEVIPKSPNIP